MRIKPFLGILILLFALGLQFWFASAGVFIDFTLAALIAFAFFFDLWELIILILFAILVINWQPAISLEITLFAVIPLAAYAFDKIFAWTTWVGIPVTLVCGYLILYVAIAPSAFFENWEIVLMDIFGSLIFAGLTGFALNK